MYLRKRNLFSFSFARTYNCTVHFCRARTHTENVKQIVCMTQLAVNRILNDGIFTTLRFCLVNSSVVRLFLFVDTTFGNRSLPSVIFIFLLLNGTCAHDGFTDDEQSCFFFPLYSRCFVYKNPFSQSGRRMRFTTNVYRRTTPLCCFSSFFARII